MSCSTPWHLPHAFSCHVTYRVCHMTYSICYMTWEGVRQVCHGGILYRYHVSIHYTLHQVSRVRQVSSVSRDAHSRSFWKSVSYVYLYTHISDTRAVCVYSRYFVCICVGIFYVCIHFGILYVYLYTHTGMRAHVYVYTHMSVTRAL